MILVICGAVFGLGAYANYRFQEKVKRFVAGTIGFLLGSVAMFVVLWILEVV